MRANAMYCTAICRTVGQQLTVCLLLLGFARWTGFWIGATTASPFEAAFQGNCHDKNPCEQKCFDLNDGTFECACRQGQRLAADGYSCKVSYNESDLDSEEEEFADQENIGQRPHGATSNGHQTKLHQIPTIQHSMSETVNGKLVHGQPKSLAQIRDIETDSHDESEDTDEDARWDDESGDKDFLLQDLQQQQYVYEELDIETIVPFTSKSGMRHTMQDQQPSVSDSTTLEYTMQLATVRNDMPQNNKNTEETASNLADDEDLFFKQKPSHMVQVQPQNNPDDKWRPFSVPSPEEPTKITQTPLEILCEHFQCQGAEPGTDMCVLEDGQPHCLCPLGRGGDHCEKDHEVRFPKFSGRSYLVLPTIRNAFKDLQVTLEFRPQSINGVLLYSGEQSNGLGDFISLILVDGYLEFRFDCGSGQGFARSRERILDHLWNRVTIFRHRWDVWMQLNNGAHAQGRSRGLFSRITFKEKLFIGGHLNSSAPDELIDHGFVGCIRYLEINGHVYDFRPAPKGNSEGGRGLGECSAEVCNDVDCKNGGKCIANSADSALCLCPLGFSGDYCEIVVDLIMPFFNGSSYLKYPGLGSSALSFIELNVAFKPSDSDGVLLYNGLRSDGGGDFLSISLSAGFLELHLDLGTGATILRSPEPVALHEWHSLEISRTARQALMRVDSQPHVEGLTPGAFTQLSLPQNLYIGGVPSFDSVSSQLGIRSSYRGCIQKVLINGKPLKLFEAALVGVNVDNCNHPCINRPCLNHGLCSPHKDYFTCHCHLGYAGSRCQTEIRENLTFPMFMGNSFLRFTRPEITSRITGSQFDIKIRFKSKSPEGLLLWSGHKEPRRSSDFISLALHDGFVQLRLSLGSGEALVQDNITLVADGQWHTVKAWRIERNASLKVDSGPVFAIVSPGPLSQVNTDTGLFLGGVPDVSTLTLGRHQGGLVGCVSNLMLDEDMHVHLVSGAQGGRNVEACV